MRIYWPLINLGALFIIPIIGAAFFLANMDRIKINTAQHGSFISQPYALTITQPEYIAGTTTEKKWTLVYVPATNIDLSLSQQNILRNLHIALNKEKERVAIVTMAKENLPQTIDENSLLIIDPQGLHIMQYDDLTNHRGLLTDLRRLLKYSHV